MITLVEIHRRLTSLRPCFIPLFFHPRVSPATPIFVHYLRFEATLQLPALAEERRVWIDEREYRRSKATSGCRAVTTNILHGCGERPFPLPLAIRRYKQPLHAERARAIFPRSSLVGKEKRMLLYDLAGRDGCSCEIVAKAGTLARGVKTALPPRSRRCPRRNPVYVGYFDLRLRDRVLIDTRRRYMGVCVASAYLAMYRIRSATPAYISWNPHVVHTHTHTHVRVYLRGRIDA